MKSKVKIKGQRSGGIRGDLRKIMKCLSSGEQLRADDEMSSSFESLAIKDYVVSGLSSKPGEAGQKLDATNIEEAEISLRESGSLNYEGVDNSRNAIKHKLCVPCGQVKKGDEQPVTHHASRVLCGQVKKGDEQPVTHHVSLVLRVPFHACGFCMLLGDWNEARALLGRIEYQKGNFEAALQVFEGIDIAAITPKIKLTLSRRVEGHRRRSQNHAIPPMSIHAVSLLLEAIFLRAKALQGLGRFKEAAQSCKLILDIVDSSLPEGLPENFGVDYKLRETLSKAVELLPELWKLADAPREAILSYRRALIHNWNLDGVTTAKIQKEFAIFLLYIGDEASPPNLRSQMDSSFVPSNNIEEAILLLMILLRKVSLKRIEWDRSILDHLSFALSVSGDLRALAVQVEGLVPEILDERERYRLLALCYYGANDSLAALNLLRNLFRNRENPNNVETLLMASKICGEIPNHAEEGIGYARRALESLMGGCDQLESSAHYLLGVSFSAHSKSAISDSERITRQCEAVQALESAERVSKMGDPNILYHLSVENAEQRKLDAALYYAKFLVKVEAGSNVKGWLLLARIISAQKRFVDAETIVDAGLDQTGKWEQGGLLRTKAKLQIAQGHLESATKTYTQLLAHLQVQNKSFGYGKKHRQESIDRAGNLELEVWHDLAYVYISLSRWHDAEGCLSKSNRLGFYSASRCHATGSIHEAKGQYKDALISYRSALDIDPDHVPSLISTAVVLRKLGNRSNAIARSFLASALRLDRMNHSTWYNLGLLYQDEATAMSLLEAADCFEAAIVLEESAPVEPFR